MCVPSANLLKILSKAWLSQGLYYPCTYSKGVHISPSPPQKKRDYQFSRALKRCSHHKTVFWRSMRPTKGRYFSLRFRETVNLRLWHQRFNIVRLLKSRGVLRQRVIKTGLTSLLLSSPGSRKSAGKILSVHITVPQDNDMHRGGITMETVLMSR